MELIEKRKRGGEKKKSFVCGNRRGEAEDFRCRILTVSGTEREKEIGEIEVYCSTLDVTISIFSIVLLFSRAARSLIVDSCNGFDSKWRKKGKRKEKENKTGLSRIGSFLSLSFFFPQLFLSSRHERGWSSTASCETTSVSNCTIDGHPAIQIEWRRTFLPLLNRLGLAGAIG